jgi:PAS domain S-box-containing protein
MDDAHPSRAPLREDVRILSQESAALGPDHLTPALLEEIAGVTLLHAVDIVNTVQLPLLILDATLHVLMANRSFYEVFQITPPETESHRLDEVDNGAWNIPSLLELLEQIVPRHTVVNDFHISHTFPRLGPKNLLINARHIVRTSGSPPLMLLTIEDITARQRAEATLRQQRDLLTVTLHSIADAVLTTDLHGRVTFLNPVAEALTGWPLHDALGQPCEAVFRLVHERTHQPLENPVTRVLHAGLVVDLAPETMLLTRDGQEIPIADLSAPIQSADAQLQGVVVVFRDVSEVRRLEEQLRQAQKMEALGTLAGGIAHDFNNILSVVLGYTELAQGGTLLNSAQWRWLQQVLTAGLRAKALVQQIFAFSHRPPTERTPVSLTGVLRETLPFLQILLPATITLEEHLPTEATLVLADATEMHEIVMNLGANAAYAMRDTGGVLAVHLEAIEVDAAWAATHLTLHPGPYARLTVCDSGPGIPPDVVARMYEPFFTTKGVGQGTGLGLSVVHGLVANQGGAIVVESTPGQRTTFTIYLPRLT